MDTLQAQSKAPLLCFKKRGVEIFAITASTKTSLHYCVKHKSLKMLQLLNTNS